MIAELGHFALILAFLVTIIQGILPVLGAHKGRQEWIALARPCAQTQFFLVAFAFACLAQSFMVNDFSVKYVAEHSNTQLPNLYRFAAVWGGHEGSLLLWLLMLSGWGVAVATFSRSLPDVVVARVLGVLGLVAIGLMAFVLLTSNPFERLLPSPAEGRDLNPLLQDPGLVFHPPMLYMGYVGFSVAFAFAIAALLAGRLDATWARWSRPWTTAAWMFLTLGIALGSWWAYYELGWGGWWFWDPVENASFMPWLVGTALIHSLAVTEKRGVFKNWTVLLAITAFSLSLLGTFLVRSGVLTSVHAFASDPSRGVFILILLAVVIGGSLALFAWRAPKVSAGGAFALFSRETFLLMNNVLLVVAAGTVLLGTLYPLLIDALNMGKLSVGPPYFNAVFVPLMVPLMMLVAVGPLARWKQADLSEMKRRLGLAAVLAIVAGIGLPMLMGTWTVMTGLGCLLAVWISSSVIFQIRERVKISSRVSAIPLAYWGMQLGHFGLAVFIVGVTMVGGFQSEMDVKMGPGDTVKVGGYEFRLAGVKNARGPNYQASIGDVEVSRNGTLERIMHPEKRQYFSGSMPMTEAAIDAGITRDIYVSLGEPLDDQGSWSVRVYHKPFVNWIWGGCVLMALGGLLAMLDRRYRTSSKSKVDEVLVDATGRVSA
ncbi:MAG: heme lyase CcmF/NrfE family subunit [Rhodocyclaceae bacterium]|nr:heme lyase CcmF/NrfE family subunit [Rhodocyclaceae bacterium]MBP6109323.1 heme lyase CcmF/NrfE family subunit [Rhodocyclaceae bacterium]MBP6278496.1 heme lyase CcmF/NrfE family subunit [Rhodocyclaceae bacterium]